MTTRSDWQVPGGWLHATGALDLTQFEASMSSWGLSWMRQTVPYLLRAFLETSPHVGSPDGTLRGLVVSKDLPVDLKNNLIAPFVEWQLAHEALIDECFASISESGQFKPSHVAEAYVRARNGGQPEGFFLNSIYGGVEPKSALNETLRPLQPMIVAMQHRCFRVITPTLLSLRASLAESRDASWAIPERDRRKLMKVAETRWAGR